MTDCSCYDRLVATDLLATFIATVSAELARAVPGIRPCVFGHIGDGNLHFNLSRPTDLCDAEFLAREADCNQIVFDHVISAGGSIAAEHGIGQLHRAELARRADPVKLELLQGIKQTLDPNDLFNPGKLL